MIPYSGALSITYVSFKNKCCLIVFSQHLNFAAQTVLNEMKKVEQQTFIYFKNEITEGSCGEVIIIEFLSCFNLSAP